MIATRWSRRSLTTIMVTVVCSAAASRARAETYPYTVQKGDTCDGIAAKLLGDKSRYEEMHEVNPELGPPPHKLKPGTILRIPKPGADAHLTHIHRDVETETPSPHKGVKDEPLMRGHRVTTQTESAAEVTFTDQTRLQLGEQTLIVILGASSSKVSGRKFLTDTTLVKGTLRAHLTALAGESGPAKDRQVPLRTETGVKVTLGTGDSKVSVDDASTTRLAVYKGESRLAAMGAEVKVPSGFGSKADLGRPPTLPKPLPAPPTWTTPPARVLLTKMGGADPASADGADVEATYQEGTSKTATPKAAKFHVQIAHDDKFNDLVVNVEVPGDVVKLSAHKLLPGSYFTRVSAIDDDKFEGAFSEVARVDVAGVKIVDGDAKTLGSVQVDGFACGLDDTRLVARTVPVPVLPRKPHKLRCAMTADATDVATMALPIMKGGDLVLTPSVGPIVPTPEGAERLITVRVKEADGSPVTDAKIDAVIKVAGVTIGPVEPLEGGAYAALVKWKRGLPDASVHLTVEQTQSLDIALENVTEGEKKAAAYVPPAEYVPPDKWIPDGWRLSVAGDLALAKTAYGTGFGGHLELGARIPLGPLQYGFGLRAGVLDFGSGSFDGEVGSKLTAFVPTFGVPIQLLFGRKKSTFVPYLSAMPTLFVAVATESSPATGGQDRNVTSVFAGLDLRVGVELLVSHFWIFGEGGYRLSQDVSGDFTSGTTSAAGPVFSLGARF